MTAEMVLWQIYDSTFLYTDDLHFILESVGFLAVHEPLGLLLGHLGGRPLQECLVKMKMMKEDQKGSKRIYEDE